MYKKGWKNFLAYDYEKLKMDMTTFFEVNNVKGTWKSNSGSWVLSSQKGFCYTSTNPFQFQFVITKASASPFERFFINFTGNGESLENLCFIEIIVRDKESFPKIQSLLCRFINQSDNNPWEVEKHPMFQLAWILRLRVKRRWKNFLTET